MADEGGDLGNLKVVITAETSGLSAGLEKAAEASKKAAENIKEGFTKVNEGIGETVKHLVEFAAILGVAIGVEAFAEFIKGGFEATDQMAKLSDKLGIGITNLYALKVAATDGGISFDTLTNSIQIMERSIDSASKVAPQLQKGFAEIGINAKELIGLKPDEAFAKVAEKLGEVKDQSEKVAIAQAIFGRGSKELIGLMSEWREKSDEAKKATADLGLAINRTDSVKVEKAVEAFELLKMAISAAAQHIAVELAPAFQAGVEAVTKFIAEAGGVGVVVQKGAAMVVEGIGWILDAWKNVQVTYAYLTEKWDEVVLAINKGAANVVLSATWIGQIFGQVWDAIVAQGKEMGAGLNVMWEGVKVAAAYVVGEIGIGWANLFQGIADNGRRVLGNDVADSMAEGAGKIRTSFASMEGQAKLSFQAAKEAAVKASEESDAAWLKIGDTDANNSPLVQSMRANVATMEGEVKQAKARLDALLDSPPPSEGFKKWVADVEKASTDAAAAIAKTKAGNDGAGEGDKKELSSYQQMLNARLASYDKYTTAAEKAEMARYQKEVDDAKQAFEKSDKSEQERNAILEGIKQDHQDRLTDIEASAVMNRRGLFTNEVQDRVSQFGRMFGNLATLTQSGNSKLVAIGKAARVAQIIMDTAAAAMASFNFGVGIGGPVLGAAFAATAIAAGAVQLATVNSTSMGGGGSVGGGGGAGVPATPAPAAGVTQGGGSGAGGILNIHLSTGGKLLSPADLQALFEQINGGIADGMNLKGVNLV